MIPELGHFALWLALGVALILAVMPMLGAARGRWEPARTRARAHGFGPGESATRALSLRRPGKGRGL